MLAVQIFGDFQLLSPAGLLQALAQEGHPVRIIAVGEQLIEVLLADGLVIMARSGGQSGMDVVYALTRWEFGTFTVTSLPNYHAETALGSCDAILLEAARRRDELPR
jgi:Domain of unknown function (DUF4388)